MYCRSNCSPLRRNPVVQRSLDLRLRGGQAKDYLKRCSCNLVILSILFLDIYQMNYFSNRNNWRFLAECSICPILALRAFVCFGNYLWLLCGIDQVIGTENQKCLLDGKDEIPFGTVYARPVMKAQGNKMGKDMKDDWPIIHWHSSFQNSFGWTKNQCFLSLQKHPLTSTYNSSYEEVCRDDFITDIRKLDDSENIYIKRKLFLKKIRNGFPDFKLAESISPMKLLQYVANLRFWISTTILQRLVNEIDYVDKMFHKYKFNFKIGAISLERLRLIAVDRKLVRTCFPMMPMLLAFLDTFGNQEYLVQRIKELSKGTYIEDYRWNSGGTIYGQEWQEHLPTDAAILFHLFCVYLDSQLMPLPQGADRRPFYSRYVIIRDGRSIQDIESCVKNKANCAILATDNQQPNPKFNFISELELHDCVYDTNNLFYVIIQFLTYMQKEQGAVLEFVSLGKSGINILPVIQNGLKVN
ncbi:uncharacterized protein LOC108037914 [Drosophila rhopaloa]|uniref:Transmembrane protein 209 n=1 Tax=Drosophila rhopaloa TaxID=1041015 RepID=A0ABM5J4H6_DRORH|nr:uncharacterized protein LOC108037914 [Drosophila rhopaloa]